EVTLEDRLPEALLARRRSWAKVLPYLVGVVIIGVWGYLMFNDEALFGMFASRTEPAVAPQVEVELEPPAAVGEGDAETAEPGATPPADQDAQAVVLIPREAVAAPDLTMPPPPTTEQGRPIAAAQEVPKVTLTPEPDAQPPMDDAAMAAATPEPEVTPQPDAFEPLPEVPAKPPLPEPYAVQDASPSGVMLHFRAMDEGWYPLRPRS